MFTISEHCKILALSSPGYGFESLHNGVLIPPGKIVVIDILYLIISWFSASANPFNPNLLAQ